MRSFILSYLIKALENNIYVHLLSNRINIILPAEKGFFLTSFCYANPIIEQRKRRICKQTLTIIYNLCIFTKWIL